MSDKIALLFMGMLVAVVVVAIYVYVQISLGYDCVAYELRWVGKSLVNQCVQYVPKATEVRDE
jgi:hypothetical protein